MQENVINAFAEQAKNMYAPLTKFNQLLVDSMEKMTEFQLESVKSYSEIGLGQLRQAAAVKDLDGLKNYSEAQVAAVSTVNKKIIEDAKVLSDMSTEFKQQVEKIFQQSTAAAQKAPAANAAPRAKAGNAKAERRTTNKSA